MYVLEECCGTVPGYVAKTKTKNKYFQLLYYFTFVRKTFTFAGIRYCIYLPLLQPDPPTPTSDWVARSTF